MISLLEFINKRKVDPAELAKRVAKRFGKTSDYGDDWEEPEKGKHIPLPKFDPETAEKVSDLAMGAKDEPKKKLIKIGSLKPTQPFVRVSDEKKLKQKISDTAPDHIRIAKHKGEHYVIDGHHAIMAAALRGEKKIKANFVNLDT